MSDISSNSETSHIVKLLNYSWIPDKSSNDDNLYCINFNKSYRPDKTPLIIEEEISDKDNIIRIIFASGKQLRISIDKSEKLIHLKKWILDCFHIYSHVETEYYMIDLINDKYIQTISDTLGINILGLNIEHICDNLVTCIIYEREKNIMICTRCTSNEHGPYNLTQSWNVLCVGDECDYGCGLFIPEGIDVHNIPDNIPEEYKLKFYDIDWFNFKRKVEYYLDIYEDFKQLSESDIEHLRDSTFCRFTSDDELESFSQGYNNASEMHEDRLTDEQRDFRFIMSCFNDNFL